MIPRNRFLCAVVLLLLQITMTARGAEPRAHRAPLFNTSSSPHAKIETVDLAAVRWTDGFWADRFERLQDVTLPALRELADDWAWHNMLVAAGDKAGEARGCHWEDAWIYKWIESAAYIFAQTGDAHLLDEMDRMIDVIARAQQDDGYLATQITLRDWPRFSSYRHHEVYTMGHLLTAACAHHRITGETAFLDVARRVADYLHREYTAGERPYLINCPVNPSIVMGAVELYRTTGERKYLDLAGIIIDNRGKKRPDPGRNDWGAVLGGSDLNQDRTPLRASREVVGHAVFWSYLYAGAADAFMETGEAALMTALDRLWDDVANRKMYVTGAVSPIHKGLSNRSFEPGKRTILNDEVHEAAGLPYELPNATAYNETCGQIGFVMWNARMLAATGDAKFADAMERTLYNSVLSGVNISGRGWSYTNPLRWYGPGHELLSNDFHQRIDPGAHQICCPTNLLRTEASWQGNLYGTSDQGLWVHQYAANRASIDMPGVGRLELTESTAYPWDGDVRLALDKVEANGDFTLRLRIPDWARGARVTINNDPVAEPVERGTYVALRRRWKSGDVIRLELPMPVRRIAAHPKLEHARNQVAVARGPIVYCLESTDLPEGVGVEQVRLPADASWEISHDANLLGGVTVLETTALAVADLGPLAEAPLYREYVPQSPREFTLRLIPYYAWNNRGEPEMTVWIPLATR